MESSLYSRNYQFNVRIDENQNNKINELLKQYNSKYQLFVRAIDNIDNSETITSDNERLQVDNERLQADNKRLQTDNERLQADNERLQADNKRLQTDNERLQTDNERLQADNEAITPDNTDILSKVINENCKIIKADNNVTCENIKILEFIFTNFGKKTDLIINKEKLLWTL